MTGILQPTVNHTLTIKEAPNSSSILELSAFPAAAATGLFGNKLSGSRTLVSSASLSNCIFTYQELATGIIMHITAISNCSVSMQWQTVVVFSAASSAISDWSRRERVASCLFKIKIRGSYTTADRGEELWRDFLF